ncbi:MAG: response regulator [Pseudomonadota bacterium]
MTHIAGRALPGQKPRVLLVEDDPAVRRSLQLLMQANGFEVRAYASGGTLLADETSLQAAGLVADYRMSECDGIDTLLQLRAKGWDCPAILITGFPSAGVANCARSAGFDTVFEKPLRQHALVKELERLVLGNGES